ncbi:MAG: methylthioribulose 1-phosphate dehydratase [Candidatus Thermoplasmatota archaeon]|nr:methylthioribulose 1-phosphate dehydratase [Candidatus Thermoplasmatota archaeon]
MPINWNNELQTALSAQIPKIIQTGKYLYDRGWLYATSGNISSVVSSRDGVIAITESGTPKGSLTPENIIAIDRDMNVLKGTGKPSSETLLHIELVSSAGAGAVIHTHSVWSNAISAHFSDSDGIYLSGYEMLKALQGVNTHKHEEFIPLLENSQNMKEVSNKIHEMMKQKEGLHGFILRKHGLYTWGKDLNEGLRHLEALEYLLETEGRLLSFKDK